MFWVDLLCDASLEVSAAVESTNLEGLALGDVRHGPLVAPRFVNVQVGFGLVFGFFVRYDPSALEACCFSTICRGEAG